MNEDEKNQLRLEISYQKGWEEYMRQFEEIQKKFTELIEELFKITPSNPAHH